MRSSRERTAVKKNAPQDGAKNGSSPACKQGSAHDYGGNRLKFHPGTEGNIGLGLIGEGHESPTILRRTNKDRKPRFLRGLLERPETPRASWVPAQRQQMVSKSRLIEGDSAEKGKQAAGAENPFSIRKPVATEELREPVLPGGLRHPGDRAMGRHINQPAIKKTAKRHDHRGELPANYEDLGIYQADQ